MCETSFFEQAHVQLVILVHMRLSVIVHFSQSNSPHDKCLPHTPPPPPPPLPPFPHTHAPPSPPNTHNHTTTHMSSVIQAQQGLPSLIIPSPFPSTWFPPDIRLRQRESRQSVVARHFFDDDALGYLERDKVTPALYPRLEFVHFHIQTVCVPCDGVVVCVSMWKKKGGGKNLSLKNETGILKKSFLNENGIQ